MAPGLNDPRMDRASRRMIRRATERRPSARNSYGRACKEDSDRAPVWTRERVLAGQVL